MKKFRLLSVITLVALFSTIGAQAVALTTTVKAKNIATTQAAVFVPSYEYGDRVSADGTFRYYVNAATNQATITQIYGGGQAHIVIPQTVDGYTVTRIGNYAGFGIKYLQSVTLPALDFIGQHAFDSCISLRTVSAPNVKGIEAYAFDNCTKLESLTIDEKVAETGIYAFRGCPLKTITAARTGIYSNEQISGTTVNDWTNVVLKLKGVNPNDPQNMFYSYNNVYFKNLSTGFTYTTENNGIKIVRYNYNSTNLVVPNIIDGKYVTKFGPEAMIRNTALKSISLPESLVTIESGCFTGCTALNELTISINTNQIGTNAFTNIPINTITIDFVQQDIQSLTLAQVKSIIDTQFKINSNQLVQITVINDSGSRVLLAPDK